MKQLKVFATRYFWLIFCVVILFQLFWISYNFIFQREGFHSDETWSYGYANSFFSPQIYLNENGQPKNFNEWISGQTLRDYIEVNDGESFRFDSVYYNQQKDLSPPIYSMLVHAVSSFFPNTFSWYYAFTLNIVFFILTQISLFFLCRTLGNTKQISLLICLFYGFTSGAINCYIYLRMYGMLTFLTVFLALLHSRMYALKFEKIGKELAALTFTIAVGALTHYYFYLIAFFMAVLFCIHLLSKKLFWSLSLYATSAISGVALSIAIFPSAVNHLQSGPAIYSVQMPFYWNLRQLTMLLTKETIGFFPYVPIALFLNYIIIFSASFLVLYIALAFLFRRDLWFHRYRANFYPWIKRVLLRIWHKIWIKGRISFYFFLAALASLTVIARISQVLLMGPFSDRYIFFLMPIYCLLVVQFLFLLLGWADKKTKWSSFLVVLIIGLMLLMNIEFGDDHYLLKRYAKGESVEHLTRNSDCILITKQNWHLTYYASLLRDVNTLYVIHFNDTMNQGPIFPLEENGKSKYLLIEKACFLDQEGFRFGNNLVKSIPGAESEKGVRLVDYLEHWQSQIGTMNIEPISSQNGFTGEIELYRLK